MSYNNNKYKYHIYSFPVVKSLHSKPDFTLPLPLLLLISVTSPIHEYEDSFELQWLDEITGWHFDEASLDRYLTNNNAKFMRSYNTLTEITKEFPEYLI
jgi:hypothetical protein